MFHKTTLIVKYRFIFFYINTTSVSYKRHYDPLYEFMDFQRVKSIKIIEEFIDTLVAN